MKLNKIKKRNFNENKDQALISKKLVTLENNSPVNKDLTEFKLKNVDK